MSATRDPKQIFQSCTLNRSGSLGYAICRNSKPVTLFSQICLANLRISHSSCHSPGQNPSLISKPSLPMDLMIKPKPLLNPMVKDLYNPRLPSNPTVLQKNPSIAGNLVYLPHCHLSFFAFNTVLPRNSSKPSHLHSPTPQSASHIKALASTHGDVSPLWNLQSIYRPCYSLSFILLCTILFFSFVSPVCSECQPGESNMLYIVYSIA